VAQDARERGRGRGECGESSCRASRARARAGLRACDSRLARAGLRACDSRLWARRGCSSQRQRPPATHLQVGVAVAGGAKEAAVGDGRHVGHQAARLRGERHGARWCSLCAGWIGHTQSASASGASTRRARTHSGPAVQVPPPLPQRAECPRAAAEGAPAAAAGPQGRAGQRSARNSARRGARRAAPAGRAHRAARRGRRRSSAAAQPPRACPRAP